MARAYRNQAEILKAKKRAAKNISELPRVNPRAARFKMSGQSSGLPIRIDGAPRSIPGRYHAMPYQVGQAAKAAANPV